VGALIIGARNSRHLYSTAAATNLTLSPRDLAEIQEVLERSKGPGGEVYGLERTPAHGGVMKYNLNHIGTKLHLIELARRVCRHCAQSVQLPASIISFVRENGAAFGLFASELESFGHKTAGHCVSWAALRLELDDIGRPEVLCCATHEDLDPEEQLGAPELVLLGLLNIVLHRGADLPGTCLQPTIEGLPSAAMVTSSQILASISIELDSNKQIEGSVVLGDCNVFIPGSAIELLSQTMWKIARFLA